MPDALVIIDFQNDFTPGGALAVPHGDEIAGRIAELVALLVDVAVAPDLELQPLRQRIDDRDADAVQSA